MLTIHTSGGKQMMQYAMEAVKGTDIKIFGVTVLTSLSDDDTNQIYKRDAFDQVNAMLDLAEESGIDGVVCSPLELTLVSKRKSLLSITPGIRLTSSDDDQKRIMTPKQAIDLGADYLVIGRPITGSEDINKSLNDIYQSIQ
jgi:orotidine-5'-phosphate decarboxylase